LQWCSGISYGHGHGYGNKDTRSDGHTVIRVHGLATKWNTDTRAHGHTDTLTQGHMDTWAWAFRHMDTETLEHRDTDKGRRTQGHGQGHGHMHGNRHRCIHVSKQVADKKDLCRYYSKMFCKTNL
jgi:hypothetical protein